MRMQLDSDAALPVRADEASLDAMSTSGNSRRSLRWRPMSTAAAADRPLPEPATADGSPVQIRPRVTLGLLSAQHSLIHAQTAVLPLVFIAVIDDFGVGVAAVGLLLAAANLLSGVAQLAYGWLTRVVPRRVILGVGGLVFGLGMVALALAGEWLWFAVLVVIARMGGSPQHPVGNTLLAEQFPPDRRRFAVSFHIAIGNMGTLIVPLVGAAIIASVGWGASTAAIGFPALVVAVAILVFIRERGEDRIAALELGSTRAGYRQLLREPNLLWLFAASSVAAAGRGIGTVTVFVPLYLSRSLGLDDGTVALMYTLLLIGSVPGPLLANRVADRFGHRRVLVATYLLGATALIVFLAAGSTIPLVWLAIGFVSAFVFEESALLQAVLADITPPSIRDVTSSAYFTLMFVVGAIWAAVLGGIVGALGDQQGFVVVFGLMAVSYLLAAVVILPVRADGGVVDRSGPVGMVETVPAVDDTAAGR